jgi:hypothetical protein
MHKHDNERQDKRAEDRRSAVTAADDTGLVAQQELLVEAELGEDSGREAPERVAGK